jgi:small subunit ribosomal protein S4
VNLPSYQVKAGDAIALSEKAQKQLRVQEAVNVSQQMDLHPSWVEVDAKKFAGVFKAVPERSDLPADINEALIVELYSK